MEQKINNNIINDILFLKTYDNNILYLVSLTMYYISFCSFYIATIQDSVDLKNNLTILASLIIFLERIVHKKLNDFFIRILKKDNSFDDRILK
ncbi:MAG: hypothetical protein ACWIPJ_10965 [Polaribacter sp.]